MCTCDNGAYGRRSCLTEEVLVSLSVAQFGPRICTLRFTATHK